MLGIIIGVGAVICTVAIGQGAGQQVQKQIQAISATNIVMVFNGSVNHGRRPHGQPGHQNADRRSMLKPFCSTSRTIAAVSPGVRPAVQVVNGNQNWLHESYRASQDYLQIRSWPVVAGSIFSQRDVDMAANVCVIGKTVAHAAFRRPGSRRPNDSRARIFPSASSACCRRRARISIGQDQDDTMIMPYTTVQKKISGISWLQMIMASTNSQEAMSGPRKSSISALLRQRHHLRPGEDDDFIIRSPNELAQAQAPPRT